MKKVKQLVQYNGPATIEVRIQHEDGFISTAYYTLPDRLMAESVFETTCNTLRTLSDVANTLHRTESYKHLRPFPLPKRGD